MKPWRRNLIIGGAILLSFTFLALIASFLTTETSLEMRLGLQLQPPSWQHWFGLDQNGTDVLAQIALGAQISLGVGITTVSLCVLIGLLVGSLAGYCGGWLDTLLMRILDVLQAFPGFLLTLAMVAVLGPSIQNLIIALCLTGWTGYARLVRGEILHLKTREYVQGAIAVGATPLRVVVLHIWPNLTALLVIQASFGLAGTILTESGLSFLGLGAPPSVPTWGSLLNSGRRVLVEAPHLSLFPGLAIVLLVLGFHLIGDGLRSWLNPKETE